MNYDCAFAASSSRWDAVIELKASEHIHLPLQAGDYWLRVRRLLKYLSPELEIACVGLAESQRRGLRLVRAVNRPERRSAAEFSGIQLQRDHRKPLSVEDCPEKERSG